jgi:hypothetical protein
MNTFSHLWQYVDELFLEWEMFETKFEEKTKKLILYSVTCCENRAVYDIHSSVICQTHDRSTASSKTIPPLNAI